MHQPAREPVPPVTRTVFPSPSAIALLHHACRASGGPKIDRAPRLREEDLHVPQAALPEARLAHRQPERLEASERLVIAELRSQIGVRDEPPAPELERAGVVSADLLHPDHAEVCLVRDAALDHLDGRQTAAREDQRVRKAPGGLLRLIEAVVDRDRLQEEETLGAEQLRAAPEEGLEVLPADR